MVRCSIDSVGVWHVSDEVSVCVSCFSGASSIFSRCYCLVWYVVVGEKVSLRYDGAYFSPYLVAVVFVVGVIVAMIVVIGDSL